MISTEDVFGFEALAFIDGFWLGWIIHYLMTRRRRDHR